MGIVERKGRVTARVTKDVKARTLMPMLWKRVEHHREDETPMFLTLLSRIPVLAERPAGVAAGTPNA